MLLSVLLSLIPLASALPTPPQRLAPIKRALDIPRAVASSNNVYIISFKQGAVDPSARGDWLDSVLGGTSSSANTTTSSGNSTSSTGHRIKDAIQGIKDAITGNKNGNGGHHNQNHQHNRRSQASDLVLGWDARVYDGLSGSFTDDELAKLQVRDEVASIQQDIQLHTTASITQTNAPWGISRLSSINSLPAGSSVSTLNYTYVFDSSGGGGVDIYVLDTGVRTTHQDFGGRAVFLQTFGTGTPGQDINGHGSHVSGTIAGSVFGVAKSSTIQAIKCVDDSGAGSTTDIVSAINLAATTALSTGRPSIASMSIAGPANDVIDSAVTNSVGLGLAFVVAAGNESRDASTDSPARVGGAGGNSGVITVGASTIADDLASFSNFGSNVDIIAPGQDVLSVGIASDSAVKNLSGTSMSTPHISGLAALILGAEGKLSPAELKSRVVGLATGAVIENVPSGTSNLLGSTINGI